MATSPRGSVAAGWAGLSGLAALSAAAVWLLGLRLLDVVPRTAGELAAARVEHWVELAVLTGGVALGAWMLVGSLAGIGCAALARRRPASGAGDVLGAWAPAVVRRLARGAVGLGVGAGLALVPVAATADDAPPSVVVLELGWQSTTVSPAATTAPVPSETGATEQTGTEHNGTGHGRPAVEQVITEVEPAVPTEENTDSPAADGQDAERPLDARRTARTLSTDEDAPREVVVVRGDTLWDIAARSLPADASDADVLRETVRWHEANAEVLGDEPDLILPGQVLRSP